MQDIYGYLSECENLILASPIHYAELSAGAKMLIVTKKSYTGYAEKLHQMLTVSDNGRRKWRFTVKIH